MQADGLLSNRDKSFFNLVDSVLIQEAKPLRKQYKGLNFIDRTHRYVEKASKLSFCIAPGPFSDIRGN